MGRRAYYKREYYNHNRDIHVMAAELSKFNIPYKLGIDSLRVGDRTLIRYKYDDSWHGRIVDGDPIFNSYNFALRWLITDLADFGVSDYGNIIKCEDFTFSYDPNPIEGSRFLDFACLHDDPNHILARIIPAIKRIELNTKKGVIYTTVIWEDGSKPTVVKKSEDDSHDLYFAVASAIAIKYYGSNSAFKREIEEKLELKNKVNMSTRIEHNSTSKYSYAYLNKSKGE